MAVFRVEKTRNYTVMANYHLNDKRLTLKAKGLLSVMLSLPDDWDYTLRGLACISVEKVDAIREAIRELERAGYIVRFRSRNEKGQLKRSEYVIREEPTVSGSPMLKKPMLENPTLDNPTLENPTLGKPMLEKPTQLSTNKPNTYLQSTYLSNPNQSIQERSDWMGLDRARAYRSEVCENIEYTVLRDEYGEARLNEIVDLMVEVLCSQKSVINIAGDDYPADLVRDRLLRLNSAHIQYVFDCLNKNATEVHNIKKYLLAVLFNAPTTMSNYYKAMINHDTNY